MAYTIKWTDTAKKDFIGIIDFLITNWSKKSAKKFENTVNKQLYLISKMPKIFPKTEARKNIRRCIVVKQVSMYYKIESDNEIIVIRFLDNRKNPNQLTNILNKT